jgi:hypothetical protein
VTLLFSSLAAARGSSATPTSSWIDLYGMQASFAGVPIPAESTITASDPQGTRCAEFVVGAAGTYGIMPCYSDDPTTGTDEGPAPGERLHFAVNGVPATPQPVTRNGAVILAGTPVTWTQNRDLWQVNLIVPPRPAVKVTLGSTAVDLTWQLAAPDVTAYEVWRSPAPYFAPGDAASEQLGVMTAVSTTLSWSDPTGVGDPAVNYTYRVRSVNATSQTLGISQAVAEFDYRLQR